MTSIVLFGDSHLGRFGKDYSEALEHLMQDTVVYNCSAGGFTSEDGAKRAELIAKLQPDVVIFSYGGNDVAPWKPLIPLKYFLHNMEIIFAAFPHSQKILFTSPDVNLVDTHQTQQFNASLHEYRSALQPVCASFNVTVVDGNEVVSSLAEAHHEDDGVHLNKAAYSKIIDAFANTIATNPLRTPH